MGEGGRRPDGGCPTANPLSLNHHCFNLSSHKKDVGKDKRFNAGLADDTRSAPPGRLNQLCLSGWLPKDGAVQIGN